MSNRPRCHVFAGPDEEATAVSDDTFRCTMATPFSESVAALVIYHEETELLDETRQHADGPPLQCLRDGDVAVAQNLTGSHVCSACGMVAEIVETDEEECEDE